MTASPPAPPPSRAHGPRRPRSNEIPSLGGLRAVSFLIVFVSHAGLQKLVPGGFGVTVFFFLSGFLITTLLRIEQETSGRVATRDFYLRRVLRILPPFYAVLALAIAGVALGLVGGPLAWAPVASLLLHYSNYWTIARGASGMPVGTVVYWSLAVEEHFYLLFPWLFRLLQRFARTGGTRARVLLGVCAAILVWRLVLVLALHSPENRTYMASDTRFDSILFGCALALGMNPVLDRMPFTDRTWRWLLLPLGALLLLVTFVVREFAFRETVRYTLQGIALVPVFVVAIRQPEWGPMRLLNLRPMRWLGELSYVLYLVHLVTIGVLETRFGMTGPLLFVAAFAIAVALAWLVHRVIELPAARLRRRLSHARLQPVAASPQP